MSDPETGAGRKDTVSSIRRLVQDKSAAQSGGRLVLDPALRTRSPGDKAATTEIVRLHPDWAVDPPRDPAPWRIPAAMRRSADATADGPDLDAKVAALEDLVAGRRDAFEPDGADTVAMARSRFGAVPWEAGDNTDETTEPDDTATIDMTEDDLRELVQTLVHKELRAALSDGGPLAEIVRDAVDAALKDAKA